MAVKSFIQRLPSNSLVLDVHCCARVVFPAIDTKLMKSSDESIRLAQYIAENMNRVTPTNVMKKYKYRERDNNFSSSNTGIAVDWINEQPNIDHSFMLEVRGKRNPLNFRDLFLNPPSDIEPVATEVEAGLQASIQFMLQNGSHELAKHAGKNQMKKNDSIINNAIIIKNVLSFHKNDTIHQNMDKMLRSPQQKIDLTLHKLEERKQLAVTHILITFCGWVGLLLFWNIAGGA